MLQSTRRASEPSAIVDDSRQRREEEHGALDPRFAELLANASGGPRDERGDGSRMSVTLSAPSATVLELDGPALGRAAARTLAAALRDAVRRRSREIELALRPSELGGLTIRVALEGLNRVHVEAVTSDPRVGERLLAGRAELERGLERWGLRLGRLSVRTRERLAELPASAPAQGPEESGEVDPARHRSFFEVVI